MQEDTQIETLMAKFFSGEASPEEAMQLADWAEASPENKTYFNNSAKFFTMDIQLTDVESRHRVWENIKNVVDATTTAQKGRQINWQWLNVAAAILAILSIALLAYTISNESNNETIYQAGTVSKKVTLKDNTDITISPNSSIIIDEDYGKARREVKLKGSAHFSVIHDAARPFIIDMDNLHIEDLGTAFSVETSPDGASIFIGVTEGEISVYDDFRYSQKLIAGQAVVYNKSKKQLSSIPTKQEKVTTVIEGKDTHTSIQNPDTTRKKSSSMSASSSESWSKKYSYDTYPAPYSTNKGYTPEGQKEMIDRADKTTKRIIAELLKDGLIENDKNVSFKLNNDGFIINGEKQSETIFKRYEKKFSPLINTNGQWSWTYNANETSTKD